jgi:hypothetical protein
MPMHERMTRFLPATARRRRRYAASVSSGGRFSGAPKRMPDGIVWSISASTEGTPIVRSISSCAAASGPMCRC